MKEKKVKLGTLSVTFLFVFAAFNIPLLLICSLGIDTLDTSMFYKMEGIITFLVILVIFLENKMFN